MPNYWGQKILLKLCQNPQLIDLYVCPGERVVELNIDRCISYIYIAADMIYLFNLATRI